MKLTKKEMQIIFMCICRFSANELREISKEENFLECANVSNEDLIKIYIKLKEKI